MPPGLAGSDDDHVRLRSAAVTSAFCRVLRPFITVSARCLLGELVLRVRKRPLVARRRIHGSINADAAAA